VMSVVGAFYYLRIIKMMYFEDSEAPLDQDVPFANKLVLGVSMVVMLLFFAGLNSIMDAANTATMALMAPF
jgi:NADH-quinone oxidoreductase subunit N